MGIFSRDKPRNPSPGKRIIPPAALARLTDVGQKTFGSTTQYVDVSDFYLTGFGEVGFPTEGIAWDGFVSRFVAELEAGAAQQGGWAHAGAFHVAKDFVKGEDWQKAELIALMDRALTFLVGAGVNGSTIPFFALPRFIELQQGPPG